MYEHLRDRSAHLNPLLPQPAAALAAAPNLQQSWGVVATNVNQTHSTVIPSRQPQSSGSNKISSSSSSSSKRQTKLRYVEYSCFQCHSIFIIFFGK